MTDEQKALLGRLRKPRICKDGVRRQPFKHEREAADLIDALTDEIARLREALDWAIAEIDGRTIYPGSDQFTSEQQFENALEAARAALAQETQP
jgi:hypothetical protein